MSKFWNRKINEIEPYVAGEQPKPGQKVIKLNTNENPFPPSPRIRAVLRTFDIGDLKLYPDTNATEFIEAVANKEGVKPSQVFAGNGSDEVLALCFQTFFEKEGNTDLPVLTPDFSYSFYPVFEKFYDIRSKKIPLREDMRLEAEDYIGVPNCGIAIANPNAPTSRSISLRDIKRIADNNPDSVVIIDEAYVEFMDPFFTAVELLPECPNLLVVRTTSKSYSLAGLRVGYAIGSEELIEGLKRARDSFNSYPTDRLAQRIAAAAVRDDHYHMACLDEIIRTRKFTEFALRGLGFKMPESSANFIFAKPPQGIDAETLYKNLRAKGILVRYFKTEGINDRLRITIGTRQDMEQLIAAVKEEVSNVQDSASRT
ncbi:MAG: histidinol-phosphate transaminase [Clostridiales bacterium]|nr:histidinol-phosphate transaminase [Clostridiales bacterium]